MVSAAYSVACYSNILNNESACFTVGGSKHEKTMYENTSAKRECFTIHFVLRVFGYPGDLHELELFIWLLKWILRRNRMFSALYADLNLEFLVHSIT